MQVLLKKPYFYLTMIGMMLATIASNGVYSAVVPHLQDRGLSAAYAAKMLSLMLVLLAVDKIVLGMLADPLRRALLHAARVCSPSPASWC